MPFLRGSGAGAGYLILNVIRVLNIIALLAVIAASCVMLVKTFVVSKFFFFDAVSHVVSACIGSKFSCHDLTSFQRQAQSLTEHSGPHLHRVASPAWLLRQKLATLQPGLRLRYAGLDYGGSWRFNSRKLEQVSYQ